MTYSTDVEGPEFLEILENGGTFVVSPSMWEIVAPLMASREPGLHELMVRQLKLTEDAGDNLYAVAKPRPLDNLCELAKLSERCVTVEYVADLPVFGTAPFGVWEVEGE